jgi:hypothetical protein
MHFAAAASTVAASDHRLASELFPPARHFGRVPSAVMITTSMNYTYWGRFDLKNSHDVLPLGLVLSCTLKHIAETGLDEQELIR